MAEKLVIDVFIDNCMGCRRQALFTDEFDGEKVIIYCEIYSCSCSQTINGELLPLSFVDRAFSLE